jgi:uridylate kinase|tara:strand:+ start:6715 stop:7386 length:672 start_codon:yes stop_codon:yes gene_type:complete
MKLVIGIGGSILASPTINIGYIKRFADFLIKLHREQYKLMVVVGGGTIARDYIQGARKLGANDQLCDELGIASTRINAMLLSAALGKYVNHPMPKVVKIPHDLSNILVMGGTKNGQTTDSVAAQIAFQVKADLLLIASNVDGVYDCDPKINPEASLFSKLNTSQLLRIVSKHKHTPGYEGIIDPLAAQLIHDKKIKTIVVNGNNLDNMRKSIKGFSYKGTLIN